LEVKKSRVIDLTYRIFISSTMDDLQEERQKIAIEIMRTQNVPIMAEYMMDVLYPPRDALAHLPSIRMEQFNIIGNGQPPYFAKRAKELHI
jgi:hypothetical protein